MSKEDKDIIHGVRYKRGSAKLYQLGNEFIVEQKYYVLFRLPLYVRKLKYATLEEAEHAYDRTKAYLYRIS